MKIEYSRFDPRYNIMVDELNKFDTDEYTSIIYPMSLKRVCYFNKDQPDCPNYMDCHMDVYNDINDTIGWDDSSVKNFDAEKVNDKFFYDNTRIPINNLEFNRIENFDKNEDNTVFRIIIIFLILLIMTIIISCEL